jgi:hypothetical protein
VLYDFSGQNTSSALIQQQLVEVYSDNVMSCHSIAKWCRLFAEWRVSIMMMRGVACQSLPKWHAPHTGELICDNRRVTLCQISIKLGLGYGIVHNVVYSELHYQEVFGCWVPRMLVQDALKACYMRPFLFDCAAVHEGGNCNARQQSLLGGHTEVVTAACLQDCCAAASQCKYHTQCNRLQPCCRSLDGSVLNSCHMALFLRQVTFIFLASLKKHPGSHRFQSDAGVEEAVSQWFCLQSTEFCAEGSIH